MKTILLLSVLFCAITFPALGELTDADIDKIRLIVNESEKRLKQEIQTEIANSEQRLKEYVDLKIEGVNKQFASIDTRFTSIDTRFTSIDKQFVSVNKRIDHVTNVVYALIALIVAAIAIPQILMAWRSGRDRTLERQIEGLAREIETLKQQQMGQP
ncbi:MAG: hypothetical protein OXH39_24640 [Candidatus Poribacteria bacterium]|nr:hypothetical protein [Candidatus Poribacteria bacterium]